MKARYARSTFGLRPSGVDASAGCLVAPDDDLGAILSRKYSDWVDWLGDGGLADGVALFFHSIVNGKLNRVHCQMDISTFEAGQLQIPVTLNLSLEERKLLAALGARQKEAVCLHLRTLGFLPRAPS
jgi:hypothetical protein